MFITRKWWVIVFMGQPTVVSSLVMKKKWEGSAQWGAVRPEAGNGVEIYGIIMWNCAQRSEIYPEASQVGAVVKEAICQCRRCPFDPWVEKIPWRRWEPTPGFLPGKSHSQRSLVGYSPRGQTQLTKHTCTPLGGRIKIHLYFLFSWLFQNFQNLASTIL